MRHNFYSWFLRVYLWLLILTSEPFCLEITEEKWENYEETFPKIDSKKIASPATKQRGRWTKALGKVKKRDSANKSKHGLINESKSVGNGKLNSQTLLQFKYVIVVVFVMLLCSFKGRIWVKYLWKIALQV